MPSARNFYDVLNVSQGAEPVVIEAAYRALMKRYHPDQAIGEDGAGGDAAEINRAFAVLRDPERRAEYDRREWSAQQRAIQLAMPPPPPPQKGSKAFGWSGWFVALCLGGALAFIVTRPGGVTAPLNAAEAARAAALSEPDFRSQPSEPSVVPLKPPRDVDVELPALVESVGPEPSALAEPEPALQARQSLRRQAPPGSRSKPPRPSARSRAAKARESDFLEREGYIY